MKIQDINKVLVEAPIADIKHVGDFSRNSSFRKAQDRLLVTSEKAIKNIKKKFAGTTKPINMIFVNSPKANRHTELGEVEFNWIEEELGTEVKEAIEETDYRNSINIIYTNNKGDQRVPATPWILAHRMGHVFYRFGDNKKYREAVNELAYWTGQILQYYNVSDDIKSRIPGLITFDALTNLGRPFELGLKDFYQKIGTFKSARTKRLREAFEMYNELFAQYLITGRIKFNNPPAYIKNIGSLDMNDRIVVREVESMLETMADHMERRFEDALSFAVGKFWVM